MQGYDRESSFYKVTFHWVDTATGQPVIHKASEFHPGQNIGIVRQYFAENTGVMIETEPYWYDLLEIVDADVGIGFQFAIGTYDSSRPGFVYLQARYEDFVIERERAYRGSFD